MTGWRQAQRLRAVSSMLGLAAGCLIGPTAHGSYFHSNLCRMGILNERIIERDVFSGPEMILVSRVEVPDKAGGVSVVASCGFIDQATDHPKVDSRRRLIALDCGGFCLKLLKRNLRVDPRLAPYILRKDNFQGKPARQAFVVLTGLRGRRSSSDDKDMWDELDTLGGSLPEIFVHGLEAEPRHNSAAGSVGRAAGHSSEFQLGACRGDQPFLRDVGLPVRLHGLFVSFGDGFLGGGKTVLGRAECQEQKRKSGDGSADVYERSNVSPHRQPMFPRPLYPILGAVLLVGGGWWSGRSLILGRVVGHAIGWLGGFMGTVLLLLGLANLYLQVLP